MFLFKLLIVIANHYETVVNGIDHQLALRLFLRGYKMKLNNKLILLVSAATLVVSAVSLPSYAEEGLYSVTNGNELDATSYKGFKLYRNWCARCHGTYGQGMVGPNLADSLKLISKEQFYDAVENGKSGRIGSMPSWKANVQVMESSDKIYAYLKARSDGAIGAEKPRKAK
ncbi:MAG: mono/diheme cytochrome c family protein [Methylophagaceae bacterium]|jgi:mono/diheme cytochrome c family protein